jgi:sugar lactone lactonase YvrE
MGLSNGDGRAATSATLNLPFGQGVTDIAGHPRAGIAVDTRGNLYISDRSNHRVRKVVPGPDGTLRTGTISTVAGTGASGFSGDGGPAVQARLNNPAGIAVDPQGAIYVADSSNRRVRRISPEGTISTVAGNGLDRIGGDGGPATQASLRDPLGVALGPDGSLYIADRAGNQVRKVAPDGSIAVFAGRGTGGGNAGEAEKALDATLDGPVGVTVLPSGEVVFADRNAQRIKLVDSAGNLWSIAGAGRTASANYGEFDPGLTRTLDENCSGLAEAPAEPCPASARDAVSATFDRPLGVAAGPDGSIYVADQNDHTVRRLMPKDVVKKVYDLPGAGRNGQDLTDFKGPAGRTIYRIMTAAGERLPPGVKSPSDPGGFIYGDGNAADGQPARSIALRVPSDVAVAPNGDLYILDQGNLRVLWVPSPGLDAPAYRVAGAYHGDSGDPRSTQLLHPRHVLPGPDGSLYVADSDRSVVRKLRPDGGFGDVVAGTGRRAGAFEEDSGPARQVSLGWPTGLAWGPDGSLYIADRGVHKIFRLKDGSLTRVAGTGRADYLGPSGFSPDGRPATQEPLSSPSGVAVAPDGTLYVADTFNSRIRRITPDGLIYDVAGTGSYGYNGDGMGGAGTTLFQPSEVKVGPDGAVYFADTGNAVIRKVDPGSGVVSIVAGTGGEAGIGGDGGAAREALLNAPDGFGFGPDGSLYVADTNNHRIRRVAPDGTITTVVGTGTAGEDGDGGQAAEAELRSPRGVAVDGDGNLVIADTDNNRVRLVGASR